MTSYLILHNRDFILQSPAACLPATWLSYRLSLGTTLTGWKGLESQTCPFFQCCEVTWHSVNSFPILQMEKPYFWEVGWWYSSFTEKQEWGPDADSEPCSIPFTIQIGDFTFIYPSINIYWAPTMWQACWSHSMWELWVLPANEMWENKK